MKTRCFLAAALLASAAPVRAQTAAGSAAIRWFRGGIES
jgi:hypothetical protein